MGKILRNTPILPSNVESRARAVLNFSVAVSVASRHRLAVVVNRALPAVPQRGRDAIHWLIMNNSFASHSTFVHNALYQFLARNLKSGFDRVPREDKEYSPETREK